MTAIYVAYGIETLSLDWLPPEAPVIVVHNDGRLSPDSVRRSSVVHLFPEENVGFGQGVNLAIDRVATDRVLICNPDTELRDHHWTELDGDAAEIVVVPQLDAYGRPTSLVNRYPSPLTVLLGALRVGRVLPRHSRLRKMLTQLLGEWGRAHRESLDVQPGTWPLVEWWASAAVFSADTDRLRAVGGFDPAYFLYFEDIDLCQRLRDRYPEMTIRCPDVSPAIHLVGGSVRNTDDRRRVRASQWSSARHYCRLNRGVGWRLAGAIIGAAPYWRFTNSLQPRPNGNN